MLLLKCKCGSFFTIKDTTVMQSRIRCPNYSESSDLSFNWELSEFTRELTKSGFSIRVIPDNAKITVTFDT